MKIETDFITENKLVLGLSGGIASGKSAALEVFASLGARAICADDISRRCFAMLKDKMEAYFGTSDKAQIAHAVFTDAQKRAWLENLLHPLILQAAREEVKTCAEKIAVVEIPLLFEKGLEDAFDLTLCVYADYNIRLKRALANFTERDFILRDKAQMPLEQKAQRADIVLINNSNRKELESKIKKFYGVLLKRPQ